MNLKQIALFAMLASCLSSPLWATSVKTVNLLEMVEGADRVFRGHCLGVTTTENVLGFPVAEYTFRVVEGIKGTKAGQTVVFRQVKPAERRVGRPGLPGIVGMPKFQKGQDLVLFLHADSEVGLTSPVGLAQGIFRLAENEKGELEVLNSLANRNLGLNLSRAQALDSGLSDQETERLKQPGPVPLRLLAGAVEKIERKRVERQKEIQ